MRIGRFKEIAQQMVKDLYEVEKDSAIEDAHQTTVSVKVSVPVSSLLNELSERFGQSRYAFSGEILEDFATDLFLSLDEKDRLEIAEKADKGTTDLLIKKGITVQSIGSAGSLNEDQTWRNLAIYEERIKEVAEK